jgi:hypothetical protein
MRYGLARLTDDALAQHARTQASTRGRLGGGLTKHERAALEGLETCTREEPTGTLWKWGPEHVAAATGIRIAEAYNALRSLEGRGLVKRWVTDATEDRWGRPRHVAFWLVSEEARRAAMARAQGAAAGSRAAAEE